MSDTLAEPSASSNSRFSAQKLADKKQQEFQDTSGESPDYEVTLLNIKIESNYEDSTNLCYIYDQKRDSDNENQTNPYKNDPSPHHKDHFQTTTVRESIKTKKAINKPTVIKTMILGLKKRPSQPGEKKFECELCEYRSRKQDTLTRHMRTHTGEADPYYLSINCY